MLLRVQPLSFPLVTAWTRSLSQPWSSTLWGLVWSYHRGGFGGPAEEEKHVEILAL